MPPATASDGGGGHGRGGGGRRRPAHGEVAVVHFSRLKRRTWLASLRLPANASALRTASSVVLTAMAAWLPTPACEDADGWRNRYGLGCVGYEAEGHCRDGAAVAGHEWALGRAFDGPETACCACGKPPEQRTERRHIMLSGLLSSGSGGLEAAERLSVGSAELGAYVDALSAHDAALRCNPRRQRTPCPDPEGVPRPPCARVGRGRELPPGVELCKGGTRKGVARGALTD